MNPEQKLKHAVLLKHFEWNPEQSRAVTAENVDSLYDEIDGDDWNLQDARGEVRGGQVDTGLPCPGSRHYESKAVAAKMPDGSWVGWTYWYGGGKHGEPDAIDWMDSAYELTCREEEKLVVVRTFEIVSASEAATAEQ